MPNYEASKESLSVELNEVLDCIGIYCPQPIFYTRRSLDKLCVGQILKVITDSLSAESDIKRLVQKLGHEIISLTTDNNKTEFIIKKIK